jgi:hypothetical protein
VVCVYAGKYLLALGEGGARISANVIQGKKYGKCEENKEENIKEKGGTARGNGS